MLKSLLCGLLIVGTAAAPLCAQSSSLEVSIGWLLGRNGETAFTPAAGFTATPFHNNGNVVELTYRYRLHRYLAAFATAGGGYGLYGIDAGYANGFYGTTSAISAIDPQVRRSTGFALATLGLAARTPTWRRLSLGVQAGAGALRFFSGALETEPIIIHNAASQPVEAGFYTTEFELDPQLLVTGAVELNFHPARRVELAFGVKRYQTFDDAVFIEAEFRDLETQAVLTRGTHREPFAAWSPMFALRIAI